MLIKVQRDTADILAKYIATDPVLQLFMGDTVLRFNYATGKVNFFLITDNITPTDKKNVIELANVTGVALCIDQIHLYYSHKSDINCEDYIALIEAYNPVLIEAPTPILHKLYKAMNSDKSGYYFSNGEAAILPLGSKLAEITLKKEQNTAQIATEKSEQNTAQIATDKSEQNTAQIATDKSEQNTAQIATDKSEQNTVQIATEKDISALCRLNSSMGDMAEIYSYDDEEKYRMKLCEGEGRIYYIEKDGEIVSMAETSFEAETSVYICDVCTHPNHRQKGYTTQIMEKLCSDLLGEGKAVGISYENLAAGRIYKKMGFILAGEYAVMELKEPGKKPN